MPHSHSMLALLADQTRMQTLSGAIAGMKSVPPFYVITGGPGSGKTTVLAELGRRGHICIPEDARALIQEQVAGTGSALPWSDAPRFAELLMQRSISTWNRFASAPPAASVYFDRGIGDAFA